VTVLHRLQGTSNTFRCKSAKTTILMTGARACKGGNFGVPWTAWASPSTYQNLQNVQKQGMAFDCYQWGCVQAAASSARLLLDLTVPHNLFAFMYFVSATTLAVTTVQVLQDWTSIQDYIQWKVFEWPFSIAQGTCYPSIFSAFCYHHGACMSAYTSWRVSHVMLLLAYRWKQKHHSSSETP
jgi:hypothetical protein